MQAATKKLLPAAAAAAAARGAWRSGARAAWSAPAVPPPAAALHGARSFSVLSLHSRVAAAAAAARSSRVPVYAPAALFSSAPQDGGKQAEVDDALADLDRDAAASTPGDAAAAEPAKEISEKVKGESSKHEFQAETKKLLDIVARSLYTDREIFVRELISNASDALEKYRHRQISGEPVADPDVTPHVTIETDEAGKRLVIQDTGIGMTREELVENLGTIAHSGTQKFLQAVEEAKGDAANVIGQFGVGFYSTFMVSENVRVFTRSAVPGSPGLCWQSDGSGSYTIAEADGVSRGTKIVIDLNETDKEFAEAKTIENIVKKHSNFIQFDINLNGDKINKIRPLWTLSPSDVSEHDHRQFYQFIANAYDEPLYTLMFSFDTPLNVKSAVYVPPSHSEKYGMGRMEPGVSLYCRRVLIQSKMKGLLPDWLRFVKGVVDCEDIPLNLSREHLQDSALVRRLGNIITRRILKFIGKQADGDEDKYMKFFEEFGGFLKEGLVTDFQYKEDLGKLLRMESSHTVSGRTTSLDKYLERAPEDQEAIYYLVAPRREFAEESPYYEGFRKRGYEVLFLYSSLDDFVMNNLSTYRGKKLVSIESAQLPGEKDDAEESEADKEEIGELRSWLQTALEDKVSSVRESNRLVDSPAIVVDHESASFRRMMKFVDPARAPQLPKQQLEINPKHPIMRGLLRAKRETPDLAKTVAEQIFDNALVTAGLIDDPRSMIPRVNRLLQQVLDGRGDGVSEAETVEPKTQADGAEAPAAGPETVEAEPVPSGKAN